MTWPGVSDFQEAIQSPQLCFADPELKTGSPVLTTLGLPRPISGGNASVYQIRSGKNEWAVRCFLRDVPDLRQRYAAIEQHLRTSRLPKAGFQYLQEGILVRGRWFPILKMEWVRGVPLNEHIEGIRQDAAALRRLADEWQGLVRLLGKEKVAHGDLQHGNVMVAKDRLVLIDYDGMFVPALRGNPSHELGHASYQHPRRQQSDFGPEVDHFSALLIHTAIQALAVRPELWERYDNSDNLLFTRDDLWEPAASALFDELAQLPDENVAAAARALRHACSEALAWVPAIDAAVKVGKKLAKKAVAKPAKAAPPQAEKAPSPPVGKPVGKSVGKPAAAAPRPAAPARAPAPSPAPATTPARQPAPAPAAASNGKVPSWLSSRMQPEPASAPAAPGTCELVEAWQRKSPQSAANQQPPAPARADWLSFLGIDLLTRWQHSRHQKATAPMRPGGQQGAGTGRSPMVKALAFSLDGQSLAIAGDDRYAEVVATANGAAICKLGPHDHAITGIVPAGSNHFATCSLDGRIRCFDRNGKVVGSWRGPHKARFYCAAASADGDLLAFGLGNRFARVWTNDGELKATLRGHGEPVLALAFGADKQHLATGSLDHTVRLWSLASKRCEQVFLGVHEVVEAVALSTDGRLLAAAGRNGRLCVWDTGSKQLLHQVDTGQHGMHALLFLPGSHVLAAGGDRAVHLFDAAHGTALGKTAGHDAPVYALAAAPDGRTVAAAGQDGKILVFRRTGRPTPPAQPPAQKPQLQLTRP